MLLLSRSWVIIISAVVTLTCTACQSKPPAEPKPAEEKEKTPAPAVKQVETIHQPPVQSAAKPAEHKSVTHKPKPQPPAPPPAIPKVVLSNEIRAACLVKVGDTMPEAELPDPAGKLHTLESLYRQKLTVVCFWTIGTTHRSRVVDVGAQHLRDLMKEVAEPFGGKGVRVIGINVGNAAPAIEKVIAQAGVKFPNLLDPKAKYFAKIAKDKRLPRIFLLDSTGRVLWFDVEFSRDSRRKLAQSIRVALGKL